jgi:sulfur-oxidizing protein SoxY
MMQQTNPEKQCSRNRLNQSSFIHYFLVFNVWLLIFSDPAYAELTIDPLDSPGWKTVHKVILANEEVVFDDRVEVIVPAVAEDPLQVPVSVRVEGIGHIVEIRVFADLNPIQKILNFHPGKIEPFIAFRFKVQQSTPVRAAARTADGVWHVGGQWLDATGGGCTAPSVGRGLANWRETLGNVKSRLWSRTDQPDRLRFRIMHPMDTGLAAGIPAFYIEVLELKDSHGDLLAQIQSYQPVSENPFFSVDLQSSQFQGLILTGRDNNGNLINQALK